MNICKHCGLETRNKKYCSLKCYHTTPISELTRAKLKKYPSPNKGKKYGLEYRKNLSLAHMGIPSKMKGKKASAFAIKRNSESHKGLVHSEESKNKTSVRMKEVWKNPDYARIVSEKVSERKKKDWKNADFAIRMLASYNKKPNKPELLLKSTIDTEGLLFKYVGNGSFWLYGHNPDFVNIQIQKVIELFGCYYHACPICRIPTSHTNNSEMLIQHYSKYGYDTLIIWEHEMKNLDLVKQKILEFAIKS